MTDTISRQAAIDAICSCVEIYLTNLPTLIYREEAETALRLVPSAQSEIIRCQDCKHYQFADNRAFGMPVKTCMWFGFEDVDDKDFCSRAERKTDE